MERSNVTPRYCSVLLLSAPFSELTYSLPPDLPQECWHVGARVVVPLGKGFRVGILLEAGLAAPEGVTVRDVLWPVDAKAFFSRSYLDFIHDLSVHQMDAPGKILSRVLPAGLRALPEFGAADGRRVRMSDLTDPERRAALCTSWCEGGLSAICPKRQTDRLFSLAAEPPWPLRPQATAQLEVLRYLDVHGVSSARALASHFGQSQAAPLAALVRKGLVREVDSHFPVQDQEAGPQHGAWCLNGEQQQAADALARLLVSEHAETALLFGVTGSGKTAVYLDLAVRCLAQGRHVFLLAPEVAIALKLYGDVRDLQPQVRTRLFHGYLNQAERQRIFLELMASGPSLVVGTRSCLFLPLEPGLVILDEEHDASFKQDEGIMYQARELAFGRISRSRGLLLLGSATPDVKIFHAAQSGGIALETLRERVGTARLPEISLVDLRSEPPENGPFAPSVREAIGETLAAGEQIILLHNRRGYAPVLYCESCSEPLRCPSCHVSLTLHKRREMALCHYCGYFVLFPVQCPQCQGNSFLPLGAGTERLEEFLRQDLPRDTRVLRLDRDTARRAGAMQDTLTAFAQGKAQVLVGTQMLSKGHHFPNVTLAVVVDGDLGLNLPDYRATERSFQMLVQVAGRAGRGEKPGRVLIQTRNPSHYCWQYVRANDYEGFYRQEIQLRKAMNYPPFVKLALVRLSFPVDMPEGDLLTTFGRRIRTLGQSLDVRVLGPAPSPLAVLRGRKRFQCLLKAANWPRIRSLCAEMRQLVDSETQVRMSVDLDPVDML